MSLGEELFSAALNGEVDDARELVRDATAEDVNWQDEVCVFYYILFGLFYT